MKIIRKDQLMHRQLKSQKTGEEFSLSVVVSDLLKSEQVFLAHDIIPPGKRSSSSHRHTFIEEIIYIVKGQLTAVTKGTEDNDIKEGTFISFDPKDKEPHYLINNTNDNAEIIVFSINRANDQTIYE